MQFAPRTESINRSRADPAMAGSTAPASRPSGTAGCRDSAYSIAFDRTDRDDAACGRSARPLNQGSLL